MMKLGKNLGMILVLVAVAVLLPASLSSALTQGKPVLNHLAAFDNFEPNSDPVAKALEKATGYKVKYHMLPAENANEVLALRISSPGEYDSVKMTVQQYNMLVANGALMPLDDLLQKYGQRILKVIGEESWKAARVNGKIYGIPEKNSSDNVNIAMAVRADILEKLGLKVPQTLDEFYRVLKTIKEKTNMIPLALYNEETSVETIISAFGLALTWTDIGGRLVSRVEHPQFKSYLEFMRKLYDEGLIDPDFPVQNRQQLLEKFTGGQAAMILFAWWDAPRAIPALQSNVPEAKVAYIQPLIGPKGEQGIAVARGIQWFAGIPRGSKHAADVIKWMNAKFEEKSFRYVTLGEEGVHYTKKDGKYYPILPKFEQDRNNASWYLTGIDESRYPGYWRARVRKNPYMSEAYDEIMKALPIAGKFEPLSFAPALPNYSKYVQSLNVLQRDQMINFIAGEVSLDQFDDFVEEWRNAGGAASTKEVNNWYQANKKR